MIGALIARDIRRGSTGLTWLPVAFFLLVVALMPFAVGPDARLLARIGPGLLWIAALTAALLPVERLIEPDRADGVLDQLTVHGVADESIAAAKIGAHWLTFGPLLLVAAIPGAGLLAMDSASLIRTELALAIGTPGLAALAVAVAAVTAGLPRAGSLAALLLLPLAVPLLIFGAANALLLEAAVSLLDAGGLTPDDVAIREYPQFNQVAGLLNGDVDLITGFRNNEPLQLEDRGMSVDLLTGDEIAPLPGPGMIVGDELLESDPELVRAFVEATAAVQAAVIDEPDLGFAAAEVAVPEISENADVAHAVLDATVDLWEGEGFANGAIDEDLWAIGYETMQRLGFIDGSVPLDEMIVTDLGGG